MLWGEQLSVYPTAFLAPELWKQARRHQLAHMLAVWTLNSGYELPDREALKERVFLTLQRRERQNRFLVQLLTLLRAHAIEPVLLKGYALSLLYPNPDMRDYCDVDLYIGERDYERMIPVIREAFPAAYWFSEEHGGLHFTMVLDEQCDLIAEMHRVTMEFHRMPRANGAFQRFTLEQMTRTQTLTLDGVSISVPNPTYNALYVFLHAWHHFTGFGVGMRQLADWALVLHFAREERQLADVLLPVLRQMHMLEVWQTFGWVLVNRLGLPRDEFPLYKDSVLCASRGERLYHQLLRDGHAGRKRGFRLFSPTLYAFPFKRPERGRLRQKTYTLCRLIFDALQLAKLFPRYAAHSFFSIPLATRTARRLLKK